ncbi:MAG: DUF1800 domain-containing protein [Caldilineaceae bacterium]
MLTRRSFFSLAKAQKNPVQNASAVEMTPELHLLNRLTYGPRPEEVERIYEIGYEAFLEEQLNPESIDDSECNAVLKQIPILEMDRATVYKLPQKEGRAHNALVLGMIQRGVHSRRQLFERMAEFWSDHFNIPAENYPVELVGMFKDVIRPQALGNFHQMLIGVTKHPAMLNYLDNASNTKDGPNENYARELMELYTLGVDGGYNEQDVKEAARALTGWTSWDATPSGFIFDMERHDTGEKSVLGHTMPADRGIDDGYHLLNLVARHPSTAHFLAFKLCRRFVSDNPSQSLVDSAAAVWQENQGQIKPVLRHLFLSDEFKASAGAKFRRPLDFLIGALRATGTKAHDYWQYYEMLTDLGQLPYGWQPPNGFPDVAGAWMSSGGLLARWNIAMQLTHGAYSEQDDFGYNLSTQIRERIGTAQTAGEVVDAVARQVFGVELSAEMRAFYLEYLNDGGRNADAVLSLRHVGRKLGTLYGLMLASPQFQWR